MAKDSQINIGCGNLSKFNDGKQVTDEQCTRLNERLNEISDMSCADALAKKTPIEQKKQSKGQKALRGIAGLMTFGLSEIGAALGGSGNTTADYKNEICNSVHNKISNTMSSFFESNHSIINDLTLQYIESTKISGSISCKTDVNVNITDTVINISNARDSDIVIGTTANQSCAVSFTNDMQTDNKIRLNIINNMLDKIKTKVENDSSLTAVSDIVSKILNDKTTDGEVNNIINKLAEVMGDQDPTSTISTSISNIIDNDTEFTNIIRDDFSSDVSQIVNRDKKYECIADSNISDGFTLKGDRLNFSNIHNSHLSIGDRITQNAFATCTNKSVDTADFFTNLTNSSTTDMSYDVLNKSTLQAQTSVKSELDNIEKTTSIIGEFLHSISTIILVIGIIIAVCIVGFGGFMLIRQLKKKKQCDFYDEAGNLVQADCDYTNQGDINEAPFNNPNITNPQSEMKLSTTPSS